MGKEKEWRWRNTEVCRYVQFQFDRFHEELGWGENEWRGMSEVSGGWRGGRWEVVGVVEGEMKERSM